MCRCHVQRKFSSWCSPRRGSFLPPPPISAPSLVRMSLYTQLHTPSERQGSLVCCTSCSHIVRPDIANEQQWFENLFQFLSHRYYAYIFGFDKWPLGSDNVPRKMELQKLEVSVIMDPECDSFPSITSDESCEYLCHGNRLFTKLLVTDSRARS